MVETIRHRPARARLLSTLAAYQRAADAQAALATAQDRIHEFDALAETLNRRLAIANERATAAESIALDVLVRLWPE